MFWSCLPLLFGRSGTSWRRFSTKGLPINNRFRYVVGWRRAAAAGIKTKIGNHSFRATGITVFRKLGASLENAALMANHASTRTTQLYDRRWAPNPWISAPLKMVPLLCSKVLLWA